MIHHKNGSMARTRTKKENYLGVNSQLCSAIQHMHLFICIVCVQREKAKETVEKRKAALFKCVWMYNKVTDIAATMSEIIILEAYHTKNGVQLCISQSRMTLK